MALRLSQSGAPAPSALATPAQLAEADAGALLARGDVDAYHILYSRSHEIDDPHRRYQLVSRLLDVGLQAAGTASRTAAPAIFAAVAQAAVEELEREPREPVLLNVAGVAFYELGALAPAEKLFKAARRLDAELAHVERNVTEIDRRRHSGTRLSALPAHVRMALKPLGRRAEDCASRAQPAKGLTLSLCMIVKDEEEMLPRCLDAVRPAVDEIVVVDTGSSDRTVEIAKSLGARVIEHEWTGSFAEARNVSLDAATGDWVIYLDADEVLVKDDADELRSLTGRVWREAFFLFETNFTGELDNGSVITHGTLRMFRNRPEYRFEGRVHEQIGHTLPTYLPERGQVTKVRIDHYGYLSTVRDSKDKTRRNVELLERQLAEGVDTAFLHFNLGSEHAVAGDDAAALAEFERAWMLAREEHDDLASHAYPPMLVARLARALRVQGRLDDCRRQAQEGLELFPGFTDLVLEQAFAAHDAGDEDEAIALLERCLEMGDAPSHYTALRGAGSYLALALLAEIRARQGDGEEAERLLSRSLADHPDFLGAVAPLATVKLARGHDPAAVIAQIEEHARLTPNVRFLLGRALHDAGHPADAATQLRAVLADQPSSEPARVALVEALLTQRQYREAAEVAAEVADDAPLAATGRRAEVFARVLDGDRQGARRALDRARESDLEAADLELLDAWLRAVEGSSLPAQIPTESTDLLATMLEDLLRVREVDPFVALLPAVDLVGLQWRERRELLAGIYLRRGFLESAADEWIMVCDETGPDEAALLGLAQVALARELPDDALVFAREVERIAPGHPAAARIVERLAPAA